MFHWLLLIVKNQGTLDWMTILQTHSQKLCMVCLVGFLYYFLSRNSVFNYNHHQNLMSFSIIILWISKIGARIFLRKDGSCTPLWWGGGVAGILCFKAGSKKFLCFKPYDLGTFGFFWGDFSLFSGQLLSDPGSYWESIRFSIWFCYLGLKSQFTFRYTKYNCMNVWIASTRPTKRWMNIRYKNDFVIEWWVGSLQLALVIHFWVSESVVWDERSSINLSQSFPWLLEGSRGV